MINRNIQINTEDKVVRIWGRIAYSEINALITNTDEEHADEYFIETLPKEIRYVSDKNKNIT